MNIFVEKQTMELLRHPREIIFEEDVKIIRENTFAVEEDGNLNPAILDLIYKRKWLQVLTPGICGGLEWKLPDVAALFEALAWADGNVGWCVNLGAGANMFAGYFSKEVACSIFNSPKIWCAGSGATSGKAKKTGGGYIISGYWKYASGSLHATHFTGNAWLTDENDQAILENGSPVFRSFIVPTEQVTIQNTWKVTGLKSTSSNDFEIKDVFIPEDHIFSLTKASAFSTGPIYSFPFEALAVVNMACMLTGMGLHFIDLFQQIILKKVPLYAKTSMAENESLKSLFMDTTRGFYAAREKMFNFLHRAWAPYEKGRDAQDHTLNQLIADAKYAAHAAEKVVCDLYSACGMNIIFEGSELNKVWRDMAVASQHYLLSPFHKV